MNKMSPRRRPAAIGILKRVLAASFTHDRPYETEVSGKKFTVFPGVHSPQYFKDAPFIVDNLKVREGETLLEIGAGCGAVSVFAALAGAQVTSTDICENAVANTKANFQLHGLSADQVLLGDLFEPVRNLGPFDTIFWNFPFGFTEQSLDEEGERNVIDPGYRCLSRFVQDAGEFLHPMGLLKMCFSPTVGNEDLLRGILSENGYQLEVDAEQSSEGFCLQLLSAAPQRRGASG